MKDSLTRRHILKTIGIAAGGMLGGGNLSYTNESGEKLILPLKEDILSIPKPVTAIVIGAGNRGNTYGDYALKFPNHLDIIGVAEPIKIRRDRHVEKHNIKNQNTFTTWEHIFEKDKFADAVIITTPDDLHYGPCMAALNKGYHVLLEKPISPTEKECRDILTLAQKTKRIVAVCHVLRYAPYFIELRKLINETKIGRLISVQHFEPIEHVHMAHSFVRGNWHNSKTSTPIILAKSCHDLDMLRWLIGQPCQEISAFGNLTWFNKSNIPIGATSRCMDGCKVEKECPYSALKIYYRDRQRTYVFDLPQNKEEHGEAILKYLETTNYGRCVYQMENDQPDHYVANMLFKNDITASFSMEAFTSYHGRRTRIMGSHGDIVGDMKSFIHTDFLSGKKTEWTMETDGHGGGDWNLVKDWVNAVATENPDLLSSPIEDSIESHIMAFKAEVSRKSKTIEKVIL